MTQADYAESWAWVHLLLETSPQRLQILRGYLQSLRTAHSAEPLAAQLRRVDPEFQQHAVDHVAALAQSLR